MTALTRKVSPLSILFRHVFRWLSLAGVAAGLAAGVAAVVPGVAPIFTARLVGPLFCPEGATSSIINLYGPQYYDSDNNLRQQKTQQINCANAQGEPVEGTGEGFMGVWYGGWIAAFVAVVTLIYFVWAVVSSVVNMARGRKAAAGA